MSEGEHCADVQTQGSLFTEAVTNCTKHGPSLCLLCLKQSHGFNTKLVFKMKNVFTASHTMKQSCN